MDCWLCGVALLDELEVSNATLRQMDCGGTCLSCDLDENNATYWLHPKTGRVMAAWPDADLPGQELFKDQFFEMAAQGVPYHLEYT